MLQNIDFDHPARLADLRLPPSLPALGRIPAGIPVEAVEERQRAELLALLSAPGRYALRVIDDSLCEAGILAGDYVIVQSQQQARDGDLVIALLDGEQLLLKRVRFGDGSIRLLADGPGEDLLLAASRIRIQGRVVGQLRRYR